jgi:hypothetical protein
VAGNSKVLSTVVSIAGEISPTLGKSIEALEQKFEGVNVKALAVGASIGAIAVGTGAAVVGATKYLAKLGDSYNSAERLNILEMSVAQIPRVRICTKGI